VKEKVNVNLVVPRSDYRKLKMRSIQEGTTVPELLREATRMSFFVHAIAQDPDTRLLVERGGEVKEIIFT